MPPETTGIRLDSVDEAHLPMLHRWLKEPHVRRWWGDPDRELELIRTGRSSGEADGYVACLDGAPVGYVQAWRPADHEDEEPWFRGTPPGTVGIDIFIGEPALAGHGLGPRLVRAFCQKLFAEGAARLVIDPDAGNERAVKAYAKAGFVAYAEHQGEAGMTVLMEMTRESFERIS